MVWWHWVLIAIPAVPVGLFVAAAGLIIAFLVVSFLLCCNFAIASLLVCCLISLVFVFWPGKDYTAPLEWWDKHNAIFWWGDNICPDTNGKN